ncbi:MAG: galactose oxidase early set domain-containing protein [Aquisalimonadaceae bacterium]
MHNKKVRSLPSLLTGAALGSVMLTSPEGGSALASPICDDPALCGQNSGLVPFHKDAVHASLFWSKHASCPKMLIAMRPSEYTPEQLFNPTTDDTFPGFDENFVNLVYGGFNAGPLDRSGWSRHAPSRSMENTQIIDVCGLQSVIDSGAFTKTELADLTDDDMNLTSPFFEDAGYSRGLGYNIFCAGNVAGVDGELIFLGGHDKGGNNGIRKVNIFEPETEGWVHRPIPCVKAEFEMDPTGTGFEHCSALDEDNTDPPTDSDMTYQRWYPTAVTMPDGRVLILSGTDQDTSVGPGNTGITKVRKDVPEVYNPRTDSTIALENAKKLQSMYPRSFVTQTGTGWNDWKVCSVGEVEPPLPGEPGGPGLGGFDPWNYNGNTYCLDVQAALNDPDRDVPAGNHWDFVDTASAAHYGGASAQIVRINADGTWSQQVYVFGGGGIATAEFIDFSDPEPSWQQIDDLATPVNQNNAVILPDGKILVVGGRAGGVDNLRYQLYDPTDGSRSDLISSQIPRHDHSTLLVMPNAGVWVMGTNRTDLLPSEEEDLAVPVLEYYQPPYLFQGPRPELLQAPGKIQYQQKFQLRVSETAGEIGSVVLLRTGPITHNWSWGNQYVSLPFMRLPNGRLLVDAPPLPGLAVAGDYMLFVVDENGVPSDGKQIRLAFRGQIAMH